LLSFALALTDVNVAAQQPDTVGQGALLAVNAARFRAMVRQDLRGVDTLLAPELTYIHSDGGLESKTQFLATLQTGRLRYRTIDPSELEARVYGNVGVVTGRSRMGVRAGRKLLQFSIRFTAMYRRVGNGWLLVAWQATRIPE
jgi:ketosteroid isomerase-like protein